VGVKRQVEAHLFQPAEHMRMRVRVYVCVREYVCMYVCVRVCEAACVSRAKYKLTTFSQRISPINKGRLSSGVMTYKPIAPTTMLSIGTVVNRSTQNRPLRAHVHTSACHHSHIMIMYVCVPNRISRMYVSVRVHAGMHVCRHAIWTRGAPICQNCIRRRIT
jgi:hypothetical protein